ncbi:hypothetical protein FRB98_004501 [Tulasnella sp. 332]|nr:hypothetical protein FRB98_004501 [Tulasnella sp. 332]
MESLLAPSIALHARSTVTNELNNPNSYLSLIWRTEICRYFSLASVIVVVWDWLTNLDEEIAYIWRPRKMHMTGKPLYLFLRYFGLAFQTYDLVINFGIWKPKLWVASWDLAFFTASLLYAVDLLLAYRALCLYRMNRKLVIFTITFFLSCVMSTIVIVAVAFFQSFRVVATPPYLTGCFSLLDSLLSAMAVPSLVFELWLVAMVVYGVLEYSKKGGKFKSSKVVQLLLMDSLNWFLIIASMIVINGIAYEVMPIGLRIVALPMLRSCCVICGCHLIIHMRQACAGEGETTITPNIPLPDTAISQGIHKPPPSSITSMEPVTGLRPYLGCSPATLLFQPRRHRHRPPSRDSGRRVTAVPEKTKLRRLLDTAQKLGMPPPLTRDLESLWDDPVMTLNLDARMGLGTNGCEHAEGEMSMPNLPSWGNSSPPCEKNEGSGSIAIASLPWLEASSTPREGDFNSREPLRLVIHDSLPKLLQDGTGSPVDLDVDHHGGNDHGHGNSQFLDSPVMFAPKCRWNTFHAGESAWSTGTPVV